MIVSPALEPDLDVCWAAVAAGEGEAGYVAPQPERGRQLGVNGGAGEEGGRGVAGHPPAQLPPRPHGGPSGVAPPLQQPQQVRVE